MELVFRELKQMEEKAAPSAFPLFLEQAWMFVVWDRSPQSCCKGQPSCRVKAAGIGPLAVCQGHLTPLFFGVGRNGYQLRRKLR